MRAARITLIVAGTLVMGYAVLGAWADPDVKPLGVLLFLAGVLVAHDGILLPVVVGAGALITRRVPEGARPAVRLGGLATVTVTLLAAPLLVGAGRAADNPSVLPRPYPLGLALVLAVIWVTALGLYLRDRRKRMERTARAVSG